MIIDHIPYYKQDTYYNCGPACIRTVLGGLGLEVPSEEDLSKIMSTSDEHGTSYDDMRDVANKFNLKVKQGEQGTLDDLDELIKDGWIPIVAYSLDVPHFSVYLGNNGNHAFFHDPFRGPRSNFLKKKFDRRWLVDKSLYTRYIKEFDVEFPDWIETVGWWIAYKSN